MCWVRIRLKIFCIDSILIMLCPCFCSQQRTGDEPILGCIGMAEPGEDYCRPIEVTTPPTPQPTSSVTPPVTPNPTSEVCILSSYYLQFLSILKIQHLLTLAHLSISIQHFSLLQVLQHPVLHSSQLISQLNPHHR